MCLTLAPVACLHKQQKTFIFSIQKLLPHGCQKSTPCNFPLFTSGPPETRKRCESETHFSGMCLLPRSGAFVDSSALCSHQLPLFFFRPALQDATSLLPHTLHLFHSLNPSVLSSLYFISEARQCCYVWHFGHVLHSFHAGSAVMTGFCGIKKALYEKVKNCKRWFLHTHCLPTFALHKSMFSVLYVNTQTVRE